MTTREVIIHTADQLIREKGYNAFSFKDISASVGIRTASIHYHFPTKTDLGIATIVEHIERFEAFKIKEQDETPTTQLESFLAIYSKIKAENKVCIVGSLATDLNTVDSKIKAQLEVFVAQVLSWLTEVLDKGKQQGEFEFELPTRTKALMIITNILAIVQLSRITTQDDFESVKQTIVNEIKPQK